MFHEPHTFDKYILTSPRSSGIDHIMTRYDSAYGAQSKELKARVFMGIGGYENADDFRKFVDELREKNYNGLELETKVIEGEGHSSGKAEGFLRGLKFVYVEHPVSVEPAVLDRYAGEYDINPQLRVTAKREDDHLVFLGPGGINLTFYAVSDKDFHKEGTFFALHFQTDETGAITGIQMDQDSGVSFAKKVH
jgi:hypothetical protein